LLTFWECADEVSCKAHSGPRAPDLQGNDCCSRTFHHGVVIPSTKVTRAYIIKLFKKNLTNLRERINVSGLWIPVHSSIYLQNKKTGLVSLTCDAWQAANQDAYFAVTGHWNEEVSPNNWENCCALFGFTQMNTAHDGVRLGRALFRIIKRIGIEHKVRL
jgi:hypothetical protein